METQVGSTPSWAEGESLMDRFFALRRGIRRALGALAAPLLVVFLLVGVMVAPAGAVTFSNPALITIPSLGAATPYPSPIAVSGLGTITDVNVTLTGVSHTYPDDIGVLLVGPLGQNVMLMHDVGADVDISGIGLTFDDAAVGSLPDSALLASGTYKPTVGTSAGFGSTGPPPAPAPAGPYGTTLSVFNGTNPVGTWNLYVYDDTTTDTGSISGGWSLSITAQAPTITSFSPPIGSQGTSVVITGTDFTGATSVMFGAIAATFTVNSATQITTSVPAGAVTATISVTTPGGTATSATSFVVAHKRTVSLSLPGDRAKGTVSVSDGFGACASAVPVKVQHFVNGRWRTVAALTTGATGSFSTGGASEDGRYRAIAKRVTTTAGEVCLKAKSPVVRN
jgi:large repetitive protein